jgi:hypothetical protein
MFRNFELKRTKTQRRRIVRRRTTPFFLLCCDNEPLEELLSYEENLSAAQAKAEEHAWIPRADVDKNRTESSIASPRKRAAQTHGQ